MTNTDLLTTDQLRERLEKVWLRHIKLCQDNFLYFVKNVWPDFICRTDSDPKKWGHHQHIAHEFTKIADFVGNLLKLKFTEDQIDNAISLSSFDKLEKMEKDNGFTESTIDKDGKRNKFFFLGPKNDWKKILNNNTSSLIEKEFEGEMKELKYL